MHKYCYNLNSVTMHAAFTRLLKKLSFMMVEHKLMCSKTLTGCKQNCEDPHAARRSYFALHCVNSVCLPQTSVDSTLLESLIRKLYYFLFNVIGNAQRLQK